MTDSNNNNNNTSDQDQLEDILMDLIDTDNRLRVELNSAYTKFKQLQDVYAKNSRAMVGMKKSLADLNGK